VFWFSVPFVELAAAAAAADVSRSSAGGSGAYETPAVVMYSWSDDGQRHTPQPKQRLAAACDPCSTGLGTSRSFLNVCAFYAGKAKSRLLCTRKKKKDHELWLPLSV
jgi:hypothetical protein